MEILHETNLGVAQAFKYITLKARVTTVWNMKKDIKMVKLKGCYHLFPYYLANNTEMLAAWPSG